MDLITYILSKRYTEQSLQGVGALKGAPCRITAIEKVENGNKITFSWTNTNGVTTSDSMIVKDGVDGTDGIGISKIDKTNTSGLVDTYTITLTDNSVFTFDITNGEDGFSPIIVENKDNTSTIYRLDITTKDGTFTTPNLKGKNGSGGGSSGEEYIHYASSDYWNSQADLIGEESHIYIYTDYTTIEKDSKTIVVPNIKIGDGKAYLVDTPFITSSVEELLSTHTTNSDIHVTTEEKEFWNTKVSCRVDENNENIIFFIGKDE